MPASDSPASQYLLRLYIAGRTVQAQRALANLQRICEAELQGRYRIEVVDLLESPEAGERENILATPTLIKELPPPLRRLIGDLSDREQVLRGLEVIPQGGGTA